MTTSLKTLWKRADNNEPLLERLTEEGRELTLSKGSLTTAIEALYKKELSIEEVEISREISLDVAAADYIGAEAGGTALRREVYLCVKARRVLYAKSVFSLVSLKDRKLLEEILKSNEPLGRSLLKEGISFKKDKLEVALIEEAEAVDYGFNGDTKGPLIARRYRLFSEADSKITINAVLIEVFSSELVEVG